MILVGASGKIWYIKADVTGRIHDSRIFHESDLFQKENYKIIEDGNSILIFFIC